MKIKLIILGVALLHSSIASAITISGIDLPQTQEGLKLNGAGVLRKGFVFKVYLGALYLDKNKVTSGDLSGMSKRIDIHYFHNTPKKYMVRAAHHTLQKNLSQSDYETLLPKVNRLHEAFRKGEKGSVASIMHHPGTGLEYRYNNQSLITLPGDDFANAYFSIWLGENPSSHTMKKAMLSGEAK